MVNIIMLLATNSKMGEDSTSIAHTNTVNIILLLATNSKMGGDSICITNPADKPDVSCYVFHKKVLI